MKSERCLPQALSVPALALYAALCCIPAAAAPAAPAEEKSVYKCPGNLYTDAITAKEAAAKGCKTLEGQPITVIQSFKPPARASSGARTEGKGEGKGESADQKARDSDARRILEAELKKAEEELAALKKDFGNGEPERRGDERNYEKYAERVASMKAAIARKEADIEALKREISKLPAQ